MQQQVLSVWTFVKKVDSYIIWATTSENRSSGFPTRSDTNRAAYSHRRWLETWNFGFRKQRDCTIQVAKTKALISFAVTAKLICVFVFAYAKIRFSHVAAHIWCSFVPNFSTQQSLKRSIPWNRCQHLLLVMLP